MTKIFLASIDEWVLIFSSLSSLSRSQSPQRITKLWTKVVGSINRGERSLVGQMGVNVEEDNPWRREGEV
jgi:hypothetical protein